MTRAEESRTATKLQRPLWSTLFILLLAGLNVKLVWTSAQNMLAGNSDFRIYYATASLVRSGRAREIYSDEAQREVQKPAENQSLLTFNHPSYEALLFVPLSFLPLQLAARFWLVLSLVLFLLVGIYLRRHILAGYNTAEVFVLLVAFTPLIACFVLAQDTLLIAALSLAAFIALRQGRDGLAGILLALALFRFHLVVPIAAALLLARRWRFVRAFTATAVVLILISVVMIGPAGVSDYLSHIIHATDPEHTRQYGLMLSNMPTINGVLSLVSWPRAVWLLIVAALGIYVIWYLKDRAFDLDSIFAIASIYSVLASPYLYMYDLTILVIPAALIIRTNRTRLNVALLVIVAALPVYLLLGAYRVVALLAIPLVILLVVVRIPRLSHGSLIEPASEAIG